MIEIEEDYIVKMSPMINCDFIGKHNICLHPALKRHKGRKCAFTTKPITEEWR